MIPTTCGGPGARSRPPARDGCSEVHLEIDGESAYAWLTIAGVEIDFHQADDAGTPPADHPSSPSSDLDVVPEPTPENLARLAAALSGPSTTKKAVDSTAATSCPTTN